MERKNNFPAGIVAIFLKNVFVFKDHGHLKRIILKGRGFRCGSDEKMMRMWFGLEVDVVGLPPLSNLLTFRPTAISDMCDVTSFYRQRRLRFVKSRKLSAANTQIVETISALDGGETIHAFNLVFLNLSLIIRLNCVVYFCDFLGVFSL